MNIESLEVLFELNHFHREKLDRIVAKEEIKLRETALTILVNEVLIDAIETKKQLSNIDLKKVDRELILELALEQRHIDVIQDMAKLIRDDFNSLERLRENFDNCTTNIEGFIELINQVQVWLAWGVNYHLDLNRTVFEGYYNDFNHSVTNSDLANSKPYYTIWQRKPNYKLVAFMLFTNRKVRYTKSILEDLGFVFGKFKGKKAIVKIINFEKF